MFSALHYPQMEIHLIQVGAGGGGGRGRIKILLIESREKRWSDGPLGSSTELVDIIDHSLLHFTLKKFGHMTIWT